MHAAAPTPPTHAADVARPPGMLPHNTAEASQPDGVVRVGEVRHSSGPDLRRELQIQQRGRDIERYEAARVEANNRNPHTFTDLCDAGIARGKADMARRDMERLIAGRSPEQRARMQAAQATRMAAEPGATR